MPSSEYSASSTAPTAGPRRIASGAPGFDPIVCLSRVEASAGTDVDDHGLRRQAEPGQEQHFFVRAGVFLRVVAGNVVGIEVFAPRAMDLVK